MSYFILFLFSQNLFYINDEIYNDKKLNWEDEIITYKDNKFSYDDKFQSIANRMLPIPNFDIRGKSITEVMTKILDYGIEHSSSFETRIVEYIVPNLDNFIDNEDFITTFDGSNIKCASFLSRGQDFKYKKDFDIIITIMR